MYVTKYSLVVARHERRHISKYGYSKVPNF